MKCRAISILLSIVILLLGLSLNAQEVKKQVGEMGSQIQNLNDLLREFKLLESLKLKRYLINNIYKAVITIVYSNQKKRKTLAFLFTYLIFTYCFHPKSLKAPCPLAFA